MNRYIKKIFLIVLFVFTYPLIVGAKDFDNMLLSHPNKTQAFMGEQKNIEWIAHSPEVLKDPKEEKEMEESVTGPDAEADDRGQVDIGKIDLYGDGKKETIKAIWGGGVSEHSLKIEVYKDNKLIATLKNDLGIQSNYKIEDLYHDGRKEIIIWSGLWDFRMPGEDGATEENYEGHSTAHRDVVEIYKLIKGTDYRDDQYMLWDVYTTKKKYEPFCEEMPKRN